MPSSWSLAPLGLFAALNIFLAFVAPSQAKGAGGPVILFAGAAALIVAGLWQRQPLWVALGCLLGLVSPVWMGLLMSGKVNWLHIAVRFGIVAVFFWLWLRVHPR